MAAPVTRDLFEPSSIPDDRNHSFQAIVITIPEHRDQRFQTIVIAISGAIVIRGTARRRAPLTVRNPGSLVLWPTAEDRDADRETVHAPHS